MQNKVNCIILMMYGGCVLETNIEITIILIPQVYKYNALLELDIQHCIWHSKHHSQTEQNGTSLILNNI